MPHWALQKGPHSWRPPFLEDFSMRLSPLAALAAVLAAPLLTACTVNNPPASPVVVQERVVVPSQAVAPPVILQRY